jgi:heme/copper-type cytochrome/quinol oxidase subunit 2
MFRYDTLREEWLIAAMFIGLAVVLYFLVFYIDLGRPRKRKQDNPEEYETNYLTAWQGIPWSVKIAAPLIMIFMVIYIIQHIIHPNSW